jgi:hypothetical protein
MQPSVDAFLEHRREFESIGKKAIAFHLIKREEQSNLYTGNRNWYAYLLNRMTTDTPFADLNNNKVGFITFNYDRSLEHFLFTALSARYGKKPEEVAQVIDSFPIVHVHGRLGYLPWQTIDGKPPDRKDHRLYNTDATPEAVDIAAKGIKIMHESMDSSPEFAKASDVMHQAQRIAILGFGYHPTNMRRLNIPLTDHEVVGTCLGHTHAEREHLMIKYRRLSLGHPTNDNLALLRDSPLFQPD